LPPAVQSPSFASPPDGRPPDRRPKESNPRKGDPTGRVPALRYGQPVVLTHGAVPSNSLCSLRSRRSNNAGKLEHEAGASCSAPARPMRCAPQHGQRGGEPCSGHHCARPSNSQTLPAPLSRHSGENWNPSIRRPSEAMARAAAPLWPCRGAQSEGWARALQDALASCSDSLQLFERSERSDRSEFCSATPRSSTAGCPQRSVGTRPVGSPFLWCLSFGDTKERYCAAGRTSRPTDLKSNNRRPSKSTAYKQGPSPLTPRIAVPPQSGGGERPAQVRIRKR